MKKYLIGTLLMVPFLSAPAYAAPADEWVENYAGEEEQAMYEFSTGANQATSGDSSDEDQNAQSNTRQSGPVFVEESESNDNVDVGGGSGLLQVPVAGNDILNDIEVGNNLLNNYSQQDNSSRPITQTRSEDNDHTIEDSFNEKVPVVVLEQRATGALRGTEAAGTLPRTGWDLLSPLALGIWMVIAGFWMLRYSRPDDLLRFMPFGLREARIGRAA